MNDWTDARLEDLVTLQRGFDISRRELNPGPVPVISSSGVIGRHNRSKASGPGVLVGRKGTLGTVHYTEQDYFPHSTALWSKNFHGNNPRFVYYFLKTLRLERFDVGAANPTLNRNHIHGLPIRIPPLPTQEKIAAVLASFDDLIANNLQRIEIVEEMARRTVEDRYLLQADTRRDEWTPTNLFNVADVRYGYGFSSRCFHEGPTGHPVVRIRDIPKNSTLTFTDENPPDNYEVKNGDILIGMDGDFHTCVWYGGDAYLNQRVARLRPRSDLPTLWLYHAIQSPIRFFNETITGTTVAHLGDRHLRTIELHVPPSKLCDEAAHQLNSLEQLILNLRQQTTHSRAARDSFLPKLISGEIDISGLDIDTSWVAA